MMILGIDPGRTTAMVVRDGDRIVAAHTRTLDLDGHLERSIDETVLDATSLIDAHPIAGVAVEGAVAPTAWHAGKIKITDPAPIIATAHLVGALVGCLAATIVPPAGHGLKVPANTPAKIARQILEDLYPPELIGPRETTGRSKSDNQHRRAAWDIAGAYHPTNRTRTADRQANP